MGKKASARYIANKYNRFYMPPWVSITVTIVLLAAVGSVLIWYMGKRSADTSRNIEDINRKLGIAPAYPARAVSPRPAQIAPRLPVPRPQPAPAPKPASIVYLDVQYLTNVFDYSNPFADPEYGKRFFAVYLEITNHAACEVYVNPFDFSLIVDQVKYSTDFSASVALFDHCPSLDSVRLAPGGITCGYVAYQVVPPRYSVGLEWTPLGAFSSDFEVRYTAR